MINDSKEDRRNRRMHQRMRRRFDALNLGKYEPIRELIWLDASENCSDVPGPEKPACCVNTALMFIDDPAAFPWMDEALAAEIARRKRYAVNQ